MATEDDNTNTGVAGTAIAVGVAAMIAGSSALVGMARTQVDEVSRNVQGYANLSAVKEHHSEQVSKLANAKMSIDKARQLTSLKGDPEQASPWTPKSAAPVATAEEATGGETAAPAAENGEAAPAATGQAAEGTEAAPAPSANP
jgi:ABC-type lipoprotein release transport system permease subunit